MQTFIKIENEWVLGDPVDGQEVKYVHDSGYSVERIYHVNSPSEVHVVITSAKIDTVEQANKTRLKVAKNSVTDLTFELQDGDGNKLPVTDDFAVPLQQLKGAVIDSLELSFVDGSATLTETWNKSGEYLITEELINTYINNEAQIFKFDGIAFSVYRKGA